MTAGGAPSPSDLRARLSERPALSPKARLRTDRQTGEAFLLYPERGLLLEGSAADVLRACDGVRTLSEVLERAAAAHGTSPEAIAEDVLGFFADLTARGLLVWNPS